MDLQVRQHRWCGTPVDRGGWIDEMSKIGLSCRFSSSSSGQSTAAHRRVGEVLIGRFELAGQTISPILHSAGHGAGEEIRLLIIRSGSMSIERKGDALQAHAGDLILTDPSFHFIESFREPTQLSLVRMPKSSLHDRGFASRVHRAFEPVPMGADVTAVREFVLNLTGHMGQASDSLLARMSAQCLDLMDVIVGKHGLGASRRSGPTIVLLAKQAIARRIGDASLDVSAVAAAINVSTSRLSRALKAEGLSAMRYAYALRIAHAGRLLSDTPDLMIREVAERCGFLSAAHFSRVFKAHHGMTPRDFALHRASRSKTDC
ncbi:helix-turn-helix transcriptional regulator [Paraburkholderia humisilvae]|uniref:HTH-type transcriptional activator RhaR n=1 Tax=Paraburkholderia humisilvae TaxID=627669 RepID=A0A6J5EVF4_9BURK|nr:AraC family transcriptional regulator [Paraburkholderia humisilvae]CAB3769186.1 HTH-type transcriptional activator RhaR [Paraburkholderia humisilvae]